MLSRIYFPVLLLVLSSCAFFRAKPSLKEQGVESLLNSIQLEGEGNGRLSIDQHQYLFSFESALQENHDWILAASIPLHGEEAMVLQSLKMKDAPSSTPDSLEVRIQQEMNHYLKKNPKLPRELSTMIIPELRSLMRFVFASKLGLKRKCQQICELDGEKFEVVIADRNIQIKKKLLHDYVLELSAENLTGPIFTKTNFTLRSQSADLKPTAVFTFELFWKS